jgi:hypothetical protein
MNRGVVARNPAGTSTGCSKRLFSKAATSEEARRYVPHIVCGRSSLQRLLANGEASLVFPTSKKLNVEPLNEVRTKLTDFFSILLGLRGTDSLLAFLRPALRPF